MTDFSTHVSTMTAHYDLLYQHPGWREYVKHQTAQMAKECPELYADLAARFNKPQPQRSSAARRPNGR